MHGSSTLGVRLSDDRISRLVRVMLAVSSNLHAAPVVRIGFPPPTPPRLSSWSSWVVLVFPSTAPFYYYYYY